MTARRSSDMLVEKASYGETVSKDEPQPSADTQALYKMFETLDHVRTTLAHGISSQEAFSGDWRKLVFTRAATELRKLADNVEKLSTPLPEQPKSDR
jgi:hypothetical protein